MGQPSVEGLPGEGARQAGQPLSCPGGLCVLLGRPHPTQGPLEPGRNSRVCAGPNVLSLSSGAHPAHQVLLACQEHDLTYPLSRVGAAVVPHPTSEACDLPRSHLALIIYPPPSASWNAPGFPNLCVLAQMATAQGRALTREPRTAHSWLARRARAEHRLGGTRGCSDRAWAPPGQDPWEGRPPGPWVAGGL